MSILYDEAQQAIANECRRVLDARTDKARLIGLLEETGQFDEAFWKTAVEQGWTALALPEAHGGLGLGLIELGLVARPVLGTKRPQSQVGNIEFDTPINQRFNYVVNHIAMPLSGQLALLTGPTTISIHDDGHVLRKSTDI